MLHKNICLKSPEITLSLICTTKHLLFFSFGYSSMRVALRRRSSRTGAAAAGESSAMAASILARARERR